MDEELALIKKLEDLRLQHEGLGVEIDKLNTGKFINVFELNRLKKEKLKLRDEMSKLQDAIYPDIIA